MIPGYIQGEFPVPDRVQVVFDALDTEEYWGIPNALKDHVKQTAATLDMLLKVEVTLSVQKWENNVWLRAHGTGAEYETCFKSSEGYWDA